jgi:hypothetical protein
MTATALPGQSFPDRLDTTILIPRAGYRPQVSREHLTRAML